MRVLDWRVFACALVPLAVLTYEGKGVLRREARGQARECP